MQSHSGWSLVSACFFPTLLSRVSLCFSGSWSCKGRAPPQTSPRRSRKPSLLWVLARLPHIRLGGASLIAVSGLFFFSLCALLTLSKKTTLQFYFAFIHPPSAPRLSLSLGSSAGSADAGVCEENHRSGRIQDGLEEHTHAHTRADAMTG